MKQGVQRDEKGWVGGIKKDNEILPQLKKKENGKYPFFPECKRNNTYLFWNKTIPTLCRK